jgi:hypothetical protein
MGRTHPPFNVLVSLGCPACGYELWVELEDLHDEETVQCTRCLLEIPLSCGSLNWPEGPDPETQAWMSGLQP